jgi:hypothetical protein
VISVSRRAHRNSDRAGDPLDGLVNLFDVGIVLAVAFLLAALSSLNLTSAFTEKGLKTPASDAVTVSPGEKTGDVPSTETQVVGHGSKVGSVYRLSDGRLIYVTGETTPGSTPAPTSTPAP